MSVEHCPHCGAIRNMRATVSRRKEAGPDGGTREVETRSLHCGTCNTFVRSEDTEVPRNEP